MYRLQFLGYSSFVLVMPLNPPWNHLSTRIKIILIFSIKMICLWVMKSTDTSFKIDFKKKKKVGHDFQNQILAWATTIFIFQVWKPNFQIYSNPIT